MIDPPHNCEYVQDYLSDSSEQPDPDRPLVYFEKYREYGIRVFDGGTSFYRIFFCPLCGTRLPWPLRYAWFKRLNALGLEPEDPRVPPEMQDGSWWRDSEVEPEDEDRMTGRFLPL